jgi:RHS repeat-associated protein
LTAAQVTYKEGSVVTEEFYHILTDHLGSITNLIQIDQAGVTSVAKFTYDAWGRPRKVNQSEEYDYAINKNKFRILDRGYTGHEHLLEHDIINMNGRIYDPIVGQFMQPDNHIQTPEDYLGYDRYTYCRGNPLKYTDPSGEVCEFKEAAWKIWNMANGIMKYMRAAMDQADNEHNMLSNHIDNLAALAEEALSQPSFRGSGKYSNEGTNDANDSDGATANETAGAKGDDTSATEDEPLKVQGPAEEGKLAPWEKITNGKPWTPTTRVIDVVAFPELSDGYSNSSSTGSETILTRTKSYSHKETGPFIESIQAIDTKRTWVGYVRDALVSVFSSGASLGMSAMDIWTSSNMNSNSTAALSLYNGSENTCGIIVQTIQTFPNVSYPTGFFFNPMPSRTTYRIYYNKINAEIGTYELIKEFTQ